MNSSDINKILSRDPHTARYFVGVFPSDKIPFLEKAAVMVVNTDTQDKPGRHWLALFVRDKNTLEFFDSYGLPPASYGQHLEDYAKRFSRLMRNCIQLQSLTSNVCGPYCIYFLVKRCQGQSMQYIVSKLKPYGKSDFKMYLYVKQRYGVKLNFRK